MESTPIRAALLAGIAGLGVTLPASVFLGALSLGAFAAALAAIWPEAASVRERLLAFASGLLAVIVVAIGHEEFLAGTSVQIKAVVAGLVGRYAVAFVLRGAKEVARRTRQITAEVLERAGVDDEQK